MGRWFLVLGGCLVVGLALCLFAVSPLLNWLDEMSASTGFARLPLNEVASSAAPLPDADEMEKLARTNPVKFLEECERRYNELVKTGYTMTMQKQERLEGKLQEVELVDVAFRETPYSVYLKWTRGARKAEAVVLVAGENNDKLLVKPTTKLAFLVGGVVERDPEGADARASGRFPLTQFGLKKGLQRTRVGWEEAAREKTLHVEYLGKKKVKEAGNRECYVLHRTRYKQPETDGVTDLTIYIDVETWFQVGVLAKGAEGQTIGEYFFRDIRLNPDFSRDQFTRKALQP